jgi:hypothetical protein
MVGGLFEGPPASLHFLDPRPQQHLVLLLVCGGCLPGEGIAQLIEPGCGGVKGPSKLSPKIKRVSQTPGRKGPQVSGQMSDQAGGRLVMAGPQVVDSRISVRGRFGSPL